MPKFHTTTIYGDLTVTGNIKGNYAKGDILYASDANTLTRLPIGTNGQVLKLAAGIPSWGNDANTWNANALNADGYVTAPTATNKNKVWKTDNNGNPGWMNDENTWTANSLNAAGYVSAPTATNKNKVWKTDGSGVPDWRDDANTWTANSVSEAGYVSAPTATNKNKVWKTDGSGVPDWRDDENTWTIATDTVAGIVSTGIQTFGGNKTFNHDVTVNGEFILPSSTTGGNRSIYATSDGLWLVVNSTSRKIYDTGNLTFSRSGNELTITR